MSVVDGMANLIVLAAEMLAAFFKINWLSCEFFFDFNGSWFTFYKIFKRIQKGLKIFEWHCLHNFALNWFRECIKGQIWKTIVNDFFQNILDGVKSSGTVLEETSCTILSPNILDARYGKK